MSLAQALAIAAAAWVTTMAADPSMTPAAHRTRTDVERLAAQLETTASLRLDGGFRATPDGIRLERRATPR